MNLLRRSNTEPLPDDTTGPWSVSRAEYDGNPMVLRLNDGLRDITGHKRYPTQAGIAIRCNTPDEHGLPSPRDTAAFDGFEDQFDQLFCEGQSALFAAVISTNGMREFVFYVSDESRFREQFRRWAETPKTHRVQMILRRDPQWSVYRTLRT
jgi:hypothetical protein